MATDIWYRIGIKGKNYKCFGEELAGFDAIRPINLIIGKNNSGKSALIDLVEIICSPRNLEADRHQNSAGEIHITARLEREDLESPWSSLPGGRRAWVGKPFTWKIAEDTTRQLVSIDPPIPSSSRLGALPSRLITLLEGQVRSRAFRRLRSDRDMVPEFDKESLRILQDGSGATKAVQHFTTKDHLQRELVTVTLLKDLKSIFEPDAIFTEIVPRQHGDQAWEIWLDQSAVGLVKLSKSGSGLRTILLVLVFIHLLPVIESRPLEKYVFAFEELENNLHPALQRRLFSYLRQMALEHGFVLFLSTHSSVVIDHFAGDEHAQILHVTHDGEVASVSTAATYLQNKEILDDLGVRASDLLQSNAVVWVEGPSDRLYFNRWIELWSGAQLREGLHYQCVCYGGSLRAHLTADDPSTESDLINIIPVNHNAIILIDSDCDNENDEISASKQRIVSEVNGMSGFAWVTAGREVENYLPPGLLASRYGNVELEPLGRFERTADYLDQVKDGEGKRFLRDKVGFARKLRPHLSKKMLAGHLDLTEKLDRVCQLIRKWNDIESEPECPSSA